MPEQTVVFPSASSGKSITGKLFLPTDEAPQGIVQILHGLAEHTGRYRGFIEFLTDKGFAVAASDHLGHGETAPEEERGYFADENGWEAVCKDAVTLAGLAKEICPGLPYFLFGHSMGSFMARTVYLADMLRMDGLILSGTGNLSSLVVSAGKRIAHGQMKRLKSGRAYSELVNSLALGGYDKPFKGEGKNAWISSIPEEVARYNADPLCGFPVKVGMFLDMFEGIAYIIKKKNIAAADKNTPILFISGALDPVGNKGKGVAAACKAFRRAGVKDVSMWLYEGCRHELLNDRAHLEVKADVLSWMRERM